MDCHADVTLQQRMLALFEAMHPGSSAYNVAVGIECRGGVDLPSLQAAYQQLLICVPRLTQTVRVARGAVRSYQGAPSTNSIKIVRTVTAGAAQMDAQRWASLPLSMAEAPLLRVRCWRYGSSCLIVLKGHHSVLDGASFAAVIDYIDSLYVAAQEGATSLRITSDRLRQDQDHHEHRWVSGRSPADVHTDFWRSQLQTVPAVPPCLLKPPNPDLASDGLATVRITSEANAFQSKVQFVDLLTAATSVVMEVISAEQLVVGVPFSNRDPRDKRVVMVANTLPLVITRDHAGSWQDTKAEVSDLLYAAFDHQDVDPMFVNSIIMAEGSRRASGVPFDLTVSIDQTFAGIQVLGMAGRIVDVPCSSAKFPLGITLRTNGPGTSSRLIVDSRGSRLSGEETRKILHKIKALLAAEG